MVRLYACCNSLPLVDKNELIKEAHIKDSGTPTPIPATSRALTSNPAPIPASSLYTDADL